MKVQHKAAKKIFSGKEIGNNKVLESIASHLRMGYLKVKNEIKYKSHNQKN